jgi:small subunit ribosomal protein S13e
MGRTYGRGKGISQSAAPYKRAPPSWFTSSPEEINRHICTLAKKGLTPSQIGVILRDSHGVGKVKNVTGNKVLRILKANGMFTPTLFHCLYFVDTRIQLSNFTKDLLPPSLRIFTT